MCSRNSSSPSLPSNGKLPAGAAKKRPQVKRIVFIGKAQACNCDRKRIDVSWKTLEKALAGKKIPLKRLQMDVHGPETALHRSMHPFIVVPAIYFFSGKNRLIKMLQGQVSLNKIKAILH